MGLVRLPRPKGWFFCADKPQLTKKSDYRRRLVPRNRATTMLGSPGGFRGGNGAGFGGDGSSFARITFQLPTRGESGKRSAAITSRSSAARLAQSAAANVGASGARASKVLPS